MNAIKRKTLAGIIISLASNSVIAAESEWDCRVSADGSSWDCFKGGNLVMQPMPKATTPIIKPATATAVPDIKTDTNETPRDTVSIEPEPKPVPEKVIEQPSQAAAAASLPEKMENKPVSREIIDVRTEQQQMAEQQPAAEPAPSVESTRPAAVRKTDPATGLKQLPETAVAESKTSTTQQSPQSTYCSFKPRRIQRTPSEPGDSSTTVDADDAVMDDNSGIAQFSGNVVLVDNDQKLVADNLKYNTNTEDVEASGNLSYQRPDMSFTGQSASMNLASETGQVTAASYKIPSSNARGKSGELHMLGNGVTAYKDATYTTCDEGNNDWQFTAAEVELNENSGIGTAKDMKLFFMDTPVLYLPWATFPIDDRRISGFLTPSVGSDDSTGFDVSAPYYLNLAPNYDATITPRIMSKRGVQLGGEFRYLDDKNNSILTAEILPDDNEYNSGDSRGAASVLHSTRFNNRLIGNLNLNYVSDDDYLEDLGGSLAVSSTRHLAREAKLTYLGDWFNIYGQVLQYQTIDKTIAKQDEPYKLLPRISFESDREIVEDLNLAINAEYSNFDHAINVDGSRIDLLPSLTYNWNRPWGYLKPRASVRYTTYDLENRAPGLESSIDRTTTTLSIDSGLILERSTSWFGNKVTHTLEPRAFYVYTPEENQDNIPLLDTKAYDFDRYSLFRENPFTGADRVGDTNQLTLALTSRLLSSQSGSQYLAGTIGQIFYFEDRKIGNVTYNHTTQTATTTAATNDNSSFVAMLEGKPLPDWSFDAGLQWDDDAIDEIEKSFLRVRYLDDDRHLFSARYQFDDTTKKEYTKISAYWPVAYNTRLVGHSYYSIEDNRAVESVLGIEHGSSCCWRLRALARDYQADASQENNLTFMLQLELRGFTSFGDDVDSFLEQTIEGFIREK